MTPPSTSPAREKVIRVMYSLLQGERAAVATYSKAMTHLVDIYATELDANQASHAKRVEALADHITRLGGKPSMAGGLWVNFTKMVEQTAAMVSDTLVIAALEQGEDIGLTDYRDALNQLDPDSRQLVQQHFLPAQELTHQRMSDLKHAS